MAGDPGLRAEVLQNRAAALGLAVSYLMTKPAFGRLPFGHWSRVLVGQINRGTYFFVYKDKRIVGFAGWAPANGSEAEAWLAGKVDPAVAEGADGTCIILNAWAAEDDDANRFIFDHTRTLFKDKEGLYAKREYPDGRARPLRLRTNDVFTGKVADLLSAEPAPATTAPPSPPSGAKPA